MATETSSTKLPTELFDEKTFYTLGGASGAVLLTCWAINYVVPSLPAEAFRIFSLILSELFAVIIVMQSKTRKPIQWFFAFLNGLLIFVNASGFNAMTASYSEKMNSKDSVDTFLPSQGIDPMQIQKTAILPLPRMINWWPDENLIRENEELRVENDALAASIQALGESGSADSLSNLVKTLTLQLAEKQKQLDAYLDQSSLEENSLQQQLTECMRIRNLKSDSLIACLAQNNSLSAQLNEHKKHTLTDHIKQVCFAKPARIRRGQKLTQDQMLVQQDFWKKFCDAFNVWVTPVE